MQRIFLHKISFIIPYLFQKHPFRNDLPLILRQNLQNPILFWRQFYRSSSDPQLLFPVIQQKVLIRKLFRCPSGGSSKHGLQMLQQYGKCHRFYQIVICTQIKCLHDIRLFLSGCQKNSRHFFPALHIPAQVSTISIRKPPVDQE